VRAMLSADSTDDGGRSLGLKARYVNKRPRVPPLLPGGSIA
jgi:hypothetical protein